MDHLRERTWNIWGVSGLRERNDILEAKAIWYSVPCDYSNDVPWMIDYLYAQMRVDITTYWRNPPRAIGQHHADTCMAWFYRRPCQCPRYTPEEWMVIRERPTVEICGVTLQDRENIAADRPIGISGHLWEDNLLKMALEYEKTWIPFSKLNPILQEKVIAGHRVRSTYTISQSYMEFIYDPDNTLRMVPVSLDRFGEQFGRYEQFIAAENAERARRRAMPRIQN